MIILPLITSAAFAALSSLDIKTFVSGSSLYIVKPDGIVLYRNDTRSARGIVLCDTLHTDSIFDAAQNGASIFALAASGIYEIDLATGGINRLPGEKTGNKNCRLACDDDYVWAGIATTLWRFDRLGREWFSFSALDTNKSFFGLFSDYDNVYCVQNNGMKVFSTKDEKWRTYPLPQNGIAFDGSRFFADKFAATLVDSTRILRYIYTAQSWDVIVAGSPIVDYVSLDTLLYYQTTHGIYSYLTKSAVGLPVDIPCKEFSGGLARVADTLVCSTPTGFLKYDLTTKTADNIAAPPQVIESLPLKTVCLDSRLIALYSNEISAYDNQFHQWQTVAISMVNRKKKVVAWDDENGLKASYARGWHTQLRGSLSQDFMIDSITQTSFVYTLPNPNANLTLHNQFANGRYLDLFFDNSRIGRVAQKGAYYRGASDDRIESVRLGTNTLDIPQSQTILNPQFEGGIITLQSKTTLANRDRRISKAQVGGGLITTRTYYEILPYSETGFYSLTSYKSGSVEKSLVPGTLKVSIDGESIDTINVNFTIETGSLTFNRQDIIDPSSVISVTYQVKTVADSGVATVELIPSNNFGTIGYGSLTVSPTDWISPQIGLVHYAPDSVHRHEFINISSPAEFRTPSSFLFLKINPELTYDARTRAKAGGLAVQSRIGEKLSIQFNGLLADSNFVSTDNIDKGYGYLEHAIDFGVLYDITKELPVTYAQHVTTSAHGVEQRYELSAAEYFAGFPFCEFSLSRNTVVADRPDTTTDDTLDRIKDKLRVRVFETTSPVLEKLFHINRFNYELSFAGFASQREDFDGVGNGNMLYGRGTINPVSQLTITLQGTYRKNAPGSQYVSEYNPSFFLQTIDLPRGLDISARNDLTFKNSANEDIGSATLNRGIGLTIKPGAWSPALVWIMPSLSFKQTFTTLLPQASQSLPNLLFPDNNAKNRLTTFGAGANFYITNDITLRNDNAIAFNDSTYKYHAFNDLKWWFGSKRFWQIRGEYDRDRHNVSTIGRKDNVHGFTRFTSTWTPWLQTATGVSLNVTDRDSSGASIVQKTYGPDASISLYTDKFLFIRSITNIHSATAYWTQNPETFQESPDISYSMYFTITVLPNICFTAKNMFLFSQSEFTRYSGSFFGSVLF